MDEAPAIREADHAHAGGERHAQQRRTETDHGPVDDPEIVGDALERVERRISGDSVGVRHRIVVPCERGDAEATHARRHLARSYLMRVKFSPPHSAPEQPSMRIACGPSSLRWPS